jgi:hypothetical protein
MSIEIDWEVTDAPTGDDGSTTAPPPVSRGGRPPGAPPPDTSQPAPRRRRWWLAIPLVLAVITAFGLNYITRLGLQRISEEIVALVRYEEQLSVQGETLLVLRVQDYTNSQWLAVRSSQVAANQPAPLPVPVLTPGSDPAEIGPVKVLDSERVLTEVYREYQTPDGQVVTFALPQFYRREANDQNWVRTGVPDSYWGNWHDWQSSHLFIRHSERDQALVDDLGPRLESILSEACAVWVRVCNGLPPAKLFFSGFVGSLEYDPLANVRVRVEFGNAENGEGLPADYFLSIPSPQMAGLPADAATEQYLTEYLAVRLIASLADTATSSQADADSLTTMAVNHLGLGDADPGFAASASDRPLGDGGIQSNGETDSESAVAAAPPVAGATLVTRLNPDVPLVTYEVQAGDTLLGIASDHAVSLDALILLNGIDDPDLIQVGTLLLIPASTAGQLGPSP